VQVGSFAGSGVILATALVHVLLPANEFLTNPCLPSFWGNYEPWAFMLCTATIVAFQASPLPAVCVSAGYGGGPEVVTWYVVPRLVCVSAGFGGEAEGQPVTPPWSLGRIWVLLVDGRAGRLSQSSVTTTAWSGGETQSCCQ
jgi:hypothetical protein